MKFISLCIACGSLLAISASAAPTQQPTTAQQATVPQKPAKQIAKSSPDAIVCKKQQVTGSRFSKRICHTNEEWARMQGDARTLMRELNDKSLPAQGDPSGGH